MRKSMSWFHLVRRAHLFSIKLTVFALASGILLGTLFTTGVRAARGQAAAPDATPLVIPPVKPLTNDFVKIAKMLEPSVVFITTDTKPDRRISQRRRPQQQDDDQDGADMLHRFFGMPLPDMPQQRRRVGSGSGFIVDRNGYILTNLHVVDEADEIKVKVQGDDTEYKARLIGSDFETDVAVLKIDAKRPLPPVKIANSDSVQVGDWAIAIGAPFGLEASVTAGIVSATGRDINTQQFQRFIQTDAAINPGNSGGPLVNYNGEVIGMNTMIATSSGGYQGIGFALPINMAAKDYNQIIQNGRVSRGSIGVEFPNSPKPEMMKALGFDHGVIVMKVTEGGPAAKAGLKPDDVLLALNGKPIKNGDDLVNRISEMPAGTQVSITIDRNKQRFDKQVTVEDRYKVFKDDPRFARTRPEMTDPNARGEETTAKFGVGIRAVTAAERKDMGISEPGGVMITAVEEGSFAEEIGLRENDVIVSINRQAVSSFDDVKRIQATLKPGAPVAFRVYRPAQGAQRGQTTWASLYVSGTLPNE
jgi:serine protease Do